MFKLDSFSNIKALFSVVSMDSAPWPIHVKGSIARRDVLFPKEK